MTFEEYLSNMKPGYTVDGGSEDHTVERTLTDLVKSGYIAKVGAGPFTGYVRI